MVSRIMLIVCLLVPVCMAAPTDNSLPQMPNFRLTRLLTDGERVVYAHWRQRWTIETTNERVDTANPMHTGALRLVQSSNGHHLVNNVYDTIDGGRLIDCDIVDEPTSVRKFVDEFVKEVMCAGRVSTVVYTRAQTTPILHNIDMVADNGSTVFEYVNDVRDARATPLLHFGTLKHECRMWHKRAQTAASVPNKRTKRSVLISPGTQWCGAGARAEYAADLGTSSATDSCCREHDQCPYFIEGMSRRFNYFNYMPYTMSYCECDNKCVDARCSHNNAYRFYSCLKQANTGTSNIIGKVFFNVVNRNCFDLKREKVCSTYSFWGSCNKFRNGLAADVKSSMRF